MTTVPTREASSVSRTLPTPGLYRHFKGGEYEVLEVARHSETEELLVIYCSVDDPATTWVRPLEMFSGVVEGSDGSFPRFELTAPSKRRSDGPLTRLLLRVLGLADRRAASSVTVALRSPLSRSGGVLPRLREPL